MPTFPMFGWFLSSLPYWCAVLVSLSPARLVGFQHFLSHALVFWVVLVACCLSFMRTRSTIALAGVAAGWASCMASAPYYAVVGFFPLGLCGLVLLTDPQTDWRRFIMRQVPWAVLIILPVLPILVAYMKVESREFAEEELLRAAWTFHHVFPPLHGARQTGFPGLWLLVFGPLLLAGGLWRIPWASFRSIRLKPLLWLGLPMLMTFLEVKELFPVTSWLRLIMILVWIGYGVLHLRTKGEGASRAMFFLLLLGICVVGTAMGPGTFFGEGRLDPSVWGISSRTIPGYRGMRELIRFTPAASILLMGLCVALSLRLRPRIHPRVWAGVMALVILAGLVDPWRPKAVREGVTPIAFSAEQEAFVRPLDGVGVEIPAAPFHRNPSAMLRWQAYRNVRLVNGYSGKTSTALKNVISAENHHGRTSEQQVSASLEAGADWMCLLRPWVYDRDEEALSATYPVLYRDEDILVVRIRPEDP